MILNKEIIEFVLENDVDLCIGTNDEGNVFCQIYGEVREEGKIIEIRLAVASPHHVPYLETESQAIRRAMKKWKGKYGNERSSHETTGV